MKRLIKQATAIALLMFINGLALGADSGPRLMSATEVMALKDNGGKLGIRYAPMELSIRNEKVAGMRIESISTISPLNQITGLQPSDMIVAINDILFSTAADMSKYIASLPPNSNPRLDYYHQADGKYYQDTIKMPGTALTAAQISNAGVVAPAATVAPSRATAPSGATPIARVINEIKEQMIDIPAGSFLMGSTEGEDDERPVHQVTVPRFRLGKFEVTFAQYDIFAEATGRPRPSDGKWGRGNRPAINIGWEDAQAFAAWVSQESGLKFRLPSEAEWEYAARGGSTTEYPWGNSFDESQANGNFKIQKTTPVGSYPPNRLGLFDMIGNASEWTADCYEASYESAPNNGSARVNCKLEPYRSSSEEYRGSPDRNAKVTRGGALSNGSKALRTSAREWDSTPTYIQSPGISPSGFRLAQDF